MEMGIAPHGPAELKCKMLILQGIAAWERVKARNHCASPELPVRKRTDTPWNFEPQRQTRTSQRAVNLNKEKDPLLLHRWFVEGYGFQPCRQDPPLSKVL